MSQNIVTLAEARIAKKGNVVVTVTKIGDLKAGTAGSGDYTRKDITVQDSSGSEQMTVWNGDIQKFQLNHKYEITSIYWKESNGKEYCNYGQYSKLQDLGIANDVSESFNEPEPQATPESSDEFLAKKQKEIEELAKKENQRPSSLTPEVAEKARKKAVHLYDLRKIVLAQILEFESDPNLGMIWEMTETIYQDLKSDLGW